MLTINKVAAAEDRLNELIASIKIQEGILEDGSKKLLALNSQYNDLDREYKILLRDKKRLAEEVEALAQNADLFSDF